MTDKKTQYAVQLIGKDQLCLNDSKDIYSPGPYQIFAKVKAVGLCFSDIKLFKQFSDHARKGPIISGVSNEALDQDPSYKPGKRPTVPGHEVCIEVVEVGEKVTYHKPGETLLVQADFRWLKTENSNGAFGYNIEGALQQYVTLDERIFVDPRANESFLLPVSSDISDSAVALVEPWTCVESSYVSKERQTILNGGKLLIVTDDGRAVKGLDKCITADCKPAEVKVCGADVELAGITVEKIASTGTVPNESVDDIIYFGCDKAVIELLNNKLAKGGIINIVLGGNKIGSETSIDVGRIHYGLTRWIGTVGDDASESYNNIPSDGEVRTGDKILVVGAAGPMGQMHVIRLVCAGIKDIEIIGTDFDDERLESLNEKASATAEKNSVKLNLVNPQKTPLAQKFDYVAVMAPVSALLAQAVKDSTSGTIINIFAGIAAGTKQAIDMDTYIENKCFMFGTSGSTLDMKIVLGKLTDGTLDTNLSADAVCGMAGAIDGIRAVENRSISGKIIVYPMLEKMGLIELSQLQEKYPTVSAKLVNGLWTEAAEKELLRTCK